MFILGFLFFFKFSLNVFHFGEMISLFVVTRENEEGSNIIDTVANLAVPPRINILIMVHYIQDSIWKMDNKKVSVSSSFSYLSLPSIKREVFTENNYDCNEMVRANR